MAPLARFVLPGIPHHVTQRGNGRQQVFFGKDDYAAYRDLRAAQCTAHGVAVWSRVLMPNRAHIVLTPSDDYGLSRTFGEARRTDAGRAHARV